MTAKRSGRAANGRSSVYLGKDGRWHGRVTMGLKSDGTPNRRHVMGLTQAAVTAKVRALEEQRRTGTVADAGRPPTLEEWLRHWLDNIAARKVRASTLDGYRTKVEHRLIPTLGKHRLDRLQPEHLEAYYATLAAEGLAPATVLQTHRILSRALKVAVQRGKVHRNVATLVDAPSLDPREIEPLTTDEAHRILRAAAGQRNATRWSVALALGLRQGEALGLAWDAVDLDKGTLAVRQAVQRIARQGLIFTQPKSRAGRRVIAMPPQLVDALRRHRAEQDEERKELGDYWEDYGLVFCQPGGRPIDPRRDWRDWKDLLAAAGVRDARLHDARHTAATLLLTQGVPARVAMQILGHSQISLTLGTYSHVVPELALDAAERVGAAL